MKLMKDMLLARLWLVKVKSKVGKSVIVELSRDQRLRCIKQL